MMFFFHVCLPSDATYKKTHTCSKNWQEGELQILVENTLGNITVLDGEFTSSSMTSKKWEEKWKEITNQINALGLGGPREWKEAVAGSQKQSFGKGVFQQQPNWK